MPTVVTAITIVPPGTRKGLSSAAAILRSRNAAAQVMTYEAMMLSEAVVTTGTIAARPAKTPTAAAPTMIAKLTIESWPEADTFALLRRFHERRASVGESYRMSGLRVRGAGTN